VVSWIVVEGRGPERLLAWLRRTVAEGRGEHLYMLADGARDERVVAELDASGLPVRCLFDGPLHPALAAAAPYIIALDADSPATLGLLSRAWGDAWGLFVTASLPLEPLRRHFRRFLRVADEDGRQLLFRYYDPRVLRVYLPTCTVTELEFVFGPVASFVVEDEGGRALRFSRAAGELVTAVVDWSTPS
jgi:hypothetical protein